MAYSHSDCDKEREAILRSLGLAKKQKPAYGDIYPFLEALFLLQVSVKRGVSLSPPSIAADLVRAKWDNGFPLCRRWEFPLDVESAQEIHRSILPHIPETNQSLRRAHGVLAELLFRDAPHSDGGSVWRIFSGEEGWVDWEEEIPLAQEDLVSFFFLGRSCIRPSIERGALDLTERFPVPEGWMKGYCPICGSLPALLFSVGEGERRAYCSWCSTRWKLHRLQCPSCDNRHHESLGYLYAESEPSYRIQYCRLCRNYFKLVDTREMLDLPYFPLEEWTTLHLDLLAQRDGWQQPGALSKVVYGDVGP